MRWFVVAALALVVAPRTGDTHPIRIDRDSRLRPPPRRPPRPPCPRTRVWSTFARCVYKGQKHRVIAGAPGAKLVAIDAGYGSEARRLELYLLAKDTWVRSNFYAETSSVTELLGFSPQAGASYRIDLGYTTATWVTLDEVSTQPALIRRLYTYVCSTNGTCGSAIIGCDVLVRGRAVATFRGEPRWDGHVLQIRGDGRNTNRYCARPPNLVDTSEDG